MAAVHIANITHGTPRTGIWCDTCALPSVIEFDVLMITDSSISPLGVYRVCVECQTENGEQA